MTPEERISRALRALYEAQEHVQPEDSSLNVEFTTQIERLRSRLEQIAGAAALREFDERRLLPASVSETPGPNEQLARELLLDPVDSCANGGGADIKDN
jgi:hypothetical protein